MADVLVIGGGAAGMMAAIFAARAGGDVTLLEHNEKLGKKIYITGKGRCNLTNDCTQDEFLAQVPRNPRFLYSALSFFAPRDMMTLLEENGCPVTVQRGRRVFPSTEKASDVTKALAGLMRKLDVRVRLNAGVRSLRTEGDAVTGAELEDGSFLRLQTATIGYTLPEKLTQKVYLRKVRVYVTGTNLFCLTKYSGYDPEVDTRRATPLTPGVDYSAYPKSIGFVAGLNLTF